MLFEVPFQTAPKTNSEFKTWKEFTNPVTRLNRQLLRFQAEEIIVCLY